MSYDPILTDPAICGNCGRENHIESEPLMTLVIKGLGGHPDGIHQDDEQIGTTHTCQCGAWCDEIDREPASATRWNRPCRYCGKGEITIYEDDQPDAPCDACVAVLKGALALMTEVAA